MPITGTETRPRLRTRLPGPRSKAIVERDDRALATTTKTAPVTAVEGRGVVVEDTDGNVLLDFAAGIGVLNTGHSHPHVVKAVQEQAARLVHFAGTDFYYDQQVALAERLGRLVPVAGPTKVFYTNSGTESNEAAIKLAKSATGRQMMVAFLGAFHGRTQGSLALTTSKPRHREGFFPAMPGVVHVPFANPYRNPWGIDGYDEPQDLTERAIAFLETTLEVAAPAKEVAALFWEPVQGEGGYVVPPKDFPRRLRRLCDDHGILLVADEVQTGFGRTGKWFAAEHFGVQADIVSLAKAMGSGLPIGAAVFRAALDFKEKGKHSNTYGGNVLACAAGLATLDVLEGERLVENSARLGKHLAKRLDELKDTHASIGDRRGLGLMQAIEFVKPGRQSGSGTHRPGAPGAPDDRMQKKVEEACWKRGLILLSCGKSSLRVIPALNVTREQLDGGMDVLGEALKACKA